MWRLANGVLLRAATAAGVACALLLGPLSSTSSPSAVTLASESCQATGYTQVNGKCLEIAHTTTLDPAASAALQDAFATPTGRAALLKVFQTLRGAKAGVVQGGAVQSGAVQADGIQTDAYVKPAWNCPGGASCGVSKSGGWHFWAIVSYAAFYDVGAFPFWIACTGALSPIIDPSQLPLPVAA